MNQIRYQMSIQNKLENIETLEHVDSFLLFLEKNDGDVLISNEHVFYALSQKQHFPTLIKGLYNSKSKMFGPTTKIQQKFKQLYKIKNTAMTIEDYSFFCDELYDCMLEIEKNDLRISNESLQFANQHFFEFPVFINLLKVFNVDLFNFDSFSNILNN